MWLFWLHNNTNIHLDLRQIDSHKILTLSIVAGLNEYLLIDIDLYQSGLKRVN